MKIYPTRSAWLHLRMAFSFFLLPVFIFAISAAPHIIVAKAIIVFIVWHFLIYPASNAYNSYFDKDEGSIALLEKPPAVDKSLYYLAIFLDCAGILLGLLVSLNFALAVFLYGVLSKLYSHPAIRLKKYPIISFLIIFIFQGAFVYWITYFSVSGSAISWETDVLMAALICSCLIGASYPLTQVYQFEEDERRGDLTLSRLLGIKASFLFSAITFAVALFLLLFYWYRLGQILNFWIFVLFALPVAYTFFSWYFKVRKDAANANYKNMSRMILTSSTMMFLYFSLIWMMHLLEK